MPYAPGIVDRRGEILAQGMVNRSTSITDGIKQAFAEAQKNEEQRRLGLAAFSGAMSQDDGTLAQTLATDPNMGKLFEKYKTGKASGQDAMQLAGYAQAVNKAKQEKQARDFQEMQKQQIAATIGHMGQQNQLLTAQTSQLAEALKKAQEERDALRSFLSNKGGVELSPEGEPVGAGEADISPEAAIRAGITDPHYLAQLNNMQKLSAPKAIPGTQVERLKDGTQVITGIGPGGKQFSHIIAAGTQDKDLNAQTSTDPVTGRPVYLDHAGNVRDAATREPLWIKQQNKMGDTVTTLHPAVEADMRKKGQPLPGEDNVPPPQDPKETAKNNLEGMTVGETRRLSSGATIKLVR